MGDTFDFVAFKPAPENAPECPNTSTAYYCTRERDHEGPHAGHGESDVPIAVWNDAGEILWEES